MKKIIVYYLLLYPSILFAQFSNNSTNSSQDWFFIGDSTTPIAQGEFPYIAVAPNETPYIAYFDYSDLNKISVKSFNGLNWEYVGGHGISSTEAYTPCLAVNSAGVPYIAYVDDSVASGKVVVRKFNGTTWEYVGPVGISPTYALGGMVQFNNSGELYLTFWDRTLFKANVMKYSGSGWVYVGSPNFSPILFDPFYLAFSPSGELFIGLLDISNSHQIMIYKFNGTDWVLFGPAGIPLGNTSPAFSMAVGHDGLPYVVYKDPVTQKLSVMKNNGTSWSLVGDEGFTSDQVGICSIDFTSSGIPMVACDDSNYANVFSLNGNIWEHVGEPDISQAKISRISFDMGYYGKPYVAYILQDSPFGLYSKFYGFPTGIENKEKIAIRVYPNPADEYINVVWPNFNREKVTVCIYNISGQLLVETATTDNRVKLDVTNYPSGIYFISVRSAHVSWSGRFCKL